jgi:hypothetical protein
MGWGWDFGWLIEWKDGKMEGIDSKERPRKNINTNSIQSLNEFHI